MAKESIKARQRKREALVARFAEKRAALKAYSQKCIPSSFA
jgi:small subunit ribosomal protein S14